MLKSKLASNMTRLPLGFIKEILGREEGDYMTRIHVSPWRWWPWKKRLYLHIYDGPDNDPHPHDHPFGFRSIILLGGYTEDVYPFEVQQDRSVIDRRRSQGVRRIRRLPLTTHKVPATHVHKIVQLHGRRTVTLLIRGGKEQDWGFFVDDFRYGLLKVPSWQYIGLPEPLKPAY